MRYALSSIVESRRVRRNISGSGFVNGYSCRNEAAFRNLTGNMRLSTSRPAAFWVDNFNLAGRDFEKELEKL